MGHEMDRRVTVRQSPHLVGQVTNADLRAIPDVEHFADTSWLLDQGEQGRHNVANPGEAAGLQAVSMHGERLAGERLPHEVGDHHAVPIALSWPDRIEEAHDNDGNLPL